MAPMMGPSRARVLRMLRGAREPQLPITLGNYEPQATIRRDHNGDRDRWLLLPLVLDQARYDAAAAAALAAGDNWMPEHAFQFLVEGAPILEAPDRAAFADALEKIRWRWGGRD